MSSNFVLPLILICLVFLTLWIISFLQWRIYLMRNWRMLVSRQNSRHICGFHLQYKVWDWTGQGAEQAAPSNGLVLLFFSYSGHILTRAYVRFICWAIFYANNSHGNLEKLCPCQNNISYWLITHFSEKRGEGK